MNDLRQRVESQFDLDSAEPAWTEVFETACAVLDTIQQLEALIASDGLLSSGSKGQAVIHPGVVELRHQRRAYAALVQQLGLPDRPETTTPRSGLREGPAQEAGSRPRPLRTPSVEGR